MSKGSKEKGRPEMRGPPGKSKNHIPGKRNVNAKMGRLLVSPGMVQDQHP